MWFNIDRKYPHYIVEPAHGPLTIGGYGSSMSVVLGPAAGAFYAGTKTGKESLKTIMKDLTSRDGEKVWVAGHLLNGELGGSGTSSINLAPLTQTANKQHSGLELKVKRLCNRARQWHELYNKTFYYGVKYTVTVVGTFGGFYPYTCVPSHFVCTAKMRKYNLLGQKIPITIGEENYFAADTFNGAQIHNRDEHFI